MQSHRQVFTNLAIAVVLSTSLIACGTAQAQEAVHSAGVAQSSSVALPARSTLSQQANRAHLHKQQRDEAAEKRALEKHQLVLFYVAARRQQMSQQWIAAVNHNLRVKWDEAVARQQQAATQARAQRDTAASRSVSISVPTSSPVTPSAPAGPAPSGSSVWYRLAQCESGGNWAINTGNSFYGGLQFTLQSWRAMGGSGLPSQASPSEQIARAERLRAVQGWGAWPACSRKLGLR